MKKILFTTIILLAISCNQKETPKPGEVLLSGKIEGLKKGTIYIQKFLDTAMVIKDSIIFSGQDTFSTKINIIEPQMLSLFLDRGQTESMDNSLQFFAEPGTMTLETSLKEFFAQAKITGSKNQIKLEEFLKMKNNFINADLDLLAKTYKTKTPAEKTAIQTKRDQNNKRKYLYTINFAKNNANMHIAPYLALKEVSDANPIYLDTIQKALKPEIAKSIYGKNLKKLIEVNK